MSNETGNRLNSREWWEQHFLEKWEAEGGPARTRQFMQLFLEGISEPDRTFLLLGGPTVLDWGCAFGDGVDELRRAAPGAQVSGLDFSHCAIAHARARYPDAEFLHSADGTIQRLFDVVITSNCLQHFANPLEIASHHLNSCRLLYGIMVPYNEWPFDPSHRAQFREESFPARLGGFERIQVQLVRPDPSVWNGEQIVVLYGSLEYLRMRSRSEVIAAGNSRGEAKTADAAGGQYQNLQQRIEQVLNRLRIAETALAQVQAGASRFREVLESHLATHRSQRAWRVMLAIRRAYTLLVREGWRGRLRFLLGRMPPVSEYDLHFPDIDAYLPAFPDSALAERITPAEQFPPRKYDIIILAIIDYDFRFQRPQQIARQWARNGHRVFWVSPTRMLPLTSEVSYSAHRLLDNLWEIRLRAPQRDHYRTELSETACFHLSEGMNQLYREWAISANCIVVHLPFWRRLALRLRSAHGGRIAYDCMDDWDTFENVSDFNRSEEVELIREADLVVVTAEKLQEKFGARGIGTVLVRNGSDFEFFRQASPAEELRDLQRPIIGYFGAIADWFDLELVRNVARSRPSYSFVLVGQVFGRDTARLASLPNVRLLGSRPYEAMPSVLAAFDVCIIPFVLNQVTHATDPVKLYEYLSQGKPVVASGMAELRRCGDVVRLAGDSTEFATQLDLALAEHSKELTEKRIEFARKSSWQARVTGFSQAIEAAFPLVSILVLTHDCAEFLSPCLRSVLRNTAYPNFEVVVVDNASSDRCAAIAESFAERDSRIKACPLSSNTGFAAGNNVAAREARGEYLVFLNADTIVTPGWLGRMLSHFWLDPTIGLLCAVTNFAGNEAKINIDYRDEREMEEFSMRVANASRGKTLDVDVAPLFCAGMRREVYGAVGGLDAGYEVGMFEDDDLSLAVRGRGLRVAIAEDCFVHHFGQGSFAKLPASEYDRVFERNRRRFETKWGRNWVPHRPRPHTRPAFEEQRFSPASFCVPELGAADNSDPAGAAAAAP